MSVSACFSTPPCVSDFEKALQNTIKDVFGVLEDPGSLKLLSCYFHFVKDLIKKPEELEILLRNNDNIKTKNFNRPLKNVCSYASN